MAASDQNLTSPPLTPSVTSNLTSHITPTLTANLTSHITPTLIANLTSSLTSSLTTGLTSRQMPNLMSNLKDNPVMTNLTSSLVCSLLSNLTSSLTSNLTCNPIASNLTSYLTSNLTSNIACSLTSNLTSSLTSSLMSSLTCDPITSNLTSNLSYITPPADTTSNTAHSFLILVISAIMFLTGVVGIPCSIVTIVVFVKLGLAETIHVSYISLAVADLGVCLCVVWLGILKIPALSDYLSKELGGAASEFIVYTIGSLQLVFIRSSALTTAWISFERCLCVLFPLKVKVVLTRRRTVKVVLAIFFLGVLPKVLHYASYLDQWQRGSEENMADFMSEAVADFRPANMAAFILATFIFVGAYCLVVVCNVFLIIKLKQAIKWRMYTTRSTSLESGNSEGITRKERRVMKTVVVLAIVFVVTTCPMMVNMFVSALDRRYTMYGSLKSYFVVLSGFAMVLNEINSSINMFIYLFMSSKFKSCMKAMLPCKVCGKESLSS